MKNDSNSLLSDTLFEMLCYNINIFGEVIMNKTANTIKMLRLLYARRNMPISKQEISEY